MNNKFFNLNSVLLNINLYYIKIPLPKDNQLMNKILHIYPRVMNAEN